MTREDAENIAFANGWNPEGVYWCECCGCWAQSPDAPCECAYQTCEGHCVGGYQGEDDG